MRTPYGVECRYFYGNYHRGRNDEECRLLQNVTQQQKWTSKLCQTCPVPGILRANACQHMILTGTINPGIFGLGKRMTIRAYCTKSNTPVREPHIGCGNCHPLPPMFEEKK